MRAALLQWGVVFARVAVRVVDVLPVTGRVGRVVGFGLEKVVHRKEAGATDRLRRSTGVFFEVERGVFSPTVFALLSPIFFCLWSISRPVASPQTRGRCGVWTVVDCAYDSTASNKHNADIVQGAAASWIGKKKIGAHFIFAFWFRVLSCKCWHVCQQGVTGRNQRMVC